MKRLLLFTLTIISAMALAQEINFPINDRNEIEFTEVIESGLTKEQLYVNAQEWIVKTFGDYKSVIQFEDRENGKLILKGWSGVPYTASTSYLIDKEKINYTIIIECKDNRYKYRVNNIIVNGSIAFGGSSLEKKPIIPFDHLIHIDNCNDKLNELFRIDTTNLNKKTLIEHNDRISFLKNEIDNESQFYKSEYECVISMIGSLKESMSVRPDGF